MAKDICLVSNQLELRAFPSTCTDLLTLSLATCATTGLPILTPGLSRTCGVCGSKCLKREDIVVMAPELRDTIMGEISAELCGGCGGKFIN